MIKKLLNNNRGTSEILGVGILMVFVILQIMPSIFNLSQTIDRLLETLDNYLKAQMTSGLNR